MFPMALLFYHSSNSDILPVRNIPVEMLLSILIYWQFPEQHFGFRLWTETCPVIVEAAPLF